MLPGTRSGNEDPAEAPLRVLLVDAHEPSRLGLALLLNRHPAVGRCAGTGRIDEAVALAERHRPGVIVLDISDRGPFVADVAGQLRLAAPDARLVLSSRCAASAATPAVVRATGAAGALTPGDRAGDVVTRIIGFARGATAAAPAPGPAAGLTAGERDVLALMTTGATNREIAAELFLSAEAVKKRASAIYRKLGVRNRTEAVQAARAA